jgi:hypothetical protein
MSRRLSLLTLAFVLWKLYNKFACVIDSLKCDNCKEVFKSVSDLRKKDT